MQHHATMSAALAVTLMTTFAACGSDTSPSEASDTTADESRAAGSVTTEGSFNVETSTFEATHPLTIAIEAEDIKETASGLEYIGEPDQQMGDSSIIAQFTEATTGAVIATADSTWSALIVHRVPLNTGCGKNPTPHTTCEYEIVETPSDWTSTVFDDSGWSPVIVWNAAAVSPQDGDDEISWDPSAELTWGTDLEADNAVLLRTTVDDND